MKRRARIVLLLGAILVSCGPADADRVSPSSPMTSAAPAPTVVIGTDATVELGLMAELYAQAVEAAGYPVRRTTSTDAASLYDELAEGSVDIAPGQLAAQLALVGVTSLGNATQDQARLRRALASDHLTVLRPSTAVWTTGFGMRHENANEHGVTMVTELAPIAENLTWGLPEDCASLAGCGDALGEAYGIDLAELAIEPLPACDADAAAALNDADVDVALLCTTQPEIERFNLVVLDDDQHAQPPGEIVPIVNDELVILAGDRLSDAIDAVSAEMTTAELTSLIARITVDGENVPDVARIWLEDHNLA